MSENDSLEKVFNHLAINLVNVILLFYIEDGLKVLKYITIPIFLSACDTEVNDFQYLSKLLCLCFLFSRLCEFLIY